MASEDRAGDLTARRASASLQRLREPLRRPARRALDALSARIVAGLGARLEATTAVAREPAPPAVVAGPLFGTVEELLHAVRSVELSQMPPGAEVLLSAGASGSWYFDWITAEYGEVRRHIGVEKYLERPRNLPANVEWVDASVADMPEVGDASVDLVFSGQNIEHLFGDDLVGFLAESARVVRPGGLLVIDSPHRERARDLVWSMNEHTIELTPTEAEQLVRLAGFEVSSLRGMWLTRDPRTGETLPLNPFVGGCSAPEVVRRIQLAPRYPDDSFMWWLEAVRTDAPCDIDGLRRRHAEIFEAAWPERYNRLSTLVGTVRLEAGYTVAATDGAGCLMLGPYMPFAAGDYSVTMTVRRRGDALPPSTVVGLLDVVADADDPTLLRRELLAADLPVDEWTSFTLRFSVPELRWTGQFRVFASGACPLEARFHVDLDDRGTAVWPSVLRRS